MSRMNQWFVLGEGIAREVITADIQRYLGPDALIRPGTGTGEYEGRPGYWITAYRTLTTQMIQDLKTDSQRWQAEKDRDQRGHGSGGRTSFSRETKGSRHPDASLVAYQDSRTHASRQHYGPSEPYNTASKSSQAYTSQSYTPSESSHYTTAPMPQYGNTHPAYAQPAQTHTVHIAQPRTDPYTNYGQPTGGGREYPSYTQTAPPYTYGQQPQDPYTRSTTTTQYAGQSVAAPGYYIASDGNQYPISQQPRRGN